jgi:hypothetical protein
MGINWRTFGNDAATSDWFVVNNIQSGLSRDGKYRLLQLGSGADSILKNSSESRDARVNH